MKNDSLLITKQDYLVIHLRWLTLFSLALINRSSPLVLIILLANGLLNTLLSFRTRFHPSQITSRWLCLVMDILTSGSTLILSTNGNPIMLLASLLPLWSAGFYFNLTGFLIAMSTNLVWFISIVLMQPDHVFAILISSIWFLIDALICVGIYFLLQRLPLLGENTTTDLASNQNHSEQTIATERRKALYQIITTLSSTLNFQMVVEKALNMSSQALFSADQSEQKLVSAYYIYHNGKNGYANLKLVSARHFTPSDQRISLRGLSGILSKAIEERTAQKAINPISDPELRRIVAFHTCKSIFCIPLCRGLEVYGVAIFAHPAPEYFTLERCETLQIITNQAMVAIENARLYHQLELEKEHILQIEEDARKKLARDLHDGPTQTVSALAMQVNYARRLLERDPKAAETELFKIEELARRATKEIRHMLFTLRPLILESEGLIAALNSMAEKMLETYNQKVIIQADERILPALELGKQSVIFTIAEEAVNNARKHAKAENIWVRLGFTQKDIILVEIEDDGVGFDQAEINNGYEQRTSMGLVNMRERAELVNGTLHIQSRPTQGTVIYLYIPLTEDASDQLSLLVYTPNKIPIHP